MENLIWLLATVCTLNSLIGMVYANVRYEHQSEDNAKYGTYNLYPSLYWYQWCFNGNLYTLQNLTFVRNATIEDNHAQLKSTNKYFLHIGPGMHNFLSR